MNDDEEGGPADVSIDSYVCTAASKGELSVLTGGLSVLTGELSVRVGCQYE